MFDIGTWALDDVLAKSASVHGLVAMTQFATAS